MVFPTTRSHTQQLLYNTEQIDGFSKQCFASFGRIFLLDTLCEVGDGTRYMVLNEITQGSWIMPSKSIVIASDHAVRGGHDPLRVDERGAAQVAAPLFGRN
mgnify:CR=1 FL=1